MSLLLSVGWYIFNTNLAVLHWIFFIRTKKNSLYLCWCRFHTVLTYSRIGRPSELCEVALFLEALIFKFLLMTQSFLPGFLQISSTHVRVSQSVSSWGITPMLCSGLLALAERGTQVKFMQLYKKKSVLLSCLQIQYFFVTLGLMKWYCKWSSVT